MSYQVGMRFSVFNLKKYSFAVGKGEIGDIKISGRDVSAADQVQ